MSDKILLILDRIIPPAANAASAIRLLIFNVFEERAPFALMQPLMSPSITHVLSLLGSVYLIGVILLTTKDLTLFSFHPIFMTVGCVLLMSEGFLVYRNGSLVNIFDPIMAGTSKAKARAIHVFIQALALIFMLAGIIFIVANKIRFEKSIIPWSVHSWVGTLAFFLVIVQAFVGPFKLSSSIPVYRWHGNSGKLAYDMCMIAVLTGALTFLPFSFINLGAELAVFVLWVSSELQHSLGERKSGDSGNSMSGSSHSEKGGVIEKEGLLGNRSFSSPNVKNTTMDNDSTPQHPEV